MFVALHHTNHSALDNNNNIILNLSFDELQKFQVASFDLLPNKGCIKEKGEREGENLFYLDRSPVELQYMTKLPLKGGDA